MNRTLRQWKDDPSLINAIDLVDASATAGDRRAGREAAYQVLTSKPPAPRALLRAAERLLGFEAPESEPEVAELGGVPTSRVVAFMRILKARLVDDPRNAIAAIELARLQTLSGQARAASRYVNLALKAAGDNRYVLRCAARFFTFVGEPDRALHAIWSSDVVRRDAWVQAAEVAVADLAGKSSKWGLRARDALTGGRISAVEASELALGLATLEYKHGGRRKVIRRLAEQGLQKPTENALAQAVWLENQANIEVCTDQKLASRKDANEALAMRQYEENRYDECVENTWRWVNDQPFSPRGYLLGASCSSIHLNDHFKALGFAKAGLQTHPDNFFLLNSMLVAQAYLGKIHEAIETHRLLANHVSQVRHRPFVLAGQGLIAYRVGDIPAGREAYLQAMNAAQESRDSGTALNAFIYWLEQEAKAGLLNFESWKDFKKSITGKISKYPSERRVWLRRTWESRSKKIDDLFLDRPLYIDSILNKLPRIQDLVLPIHL